MTFAIANEQLPAGLRLLRRVLLVELLVAAACYIVFTWHWMLICDSPIMHYVNLLMAHGMKPYLEITDNNLPGSYLSEAFGMRLFGAGDLGWRFYEFFLLATMAVAMSIVALPYDWMAGAFASGMFLLMHGTEGPWFAGERELTMTVLVLGGYAALFTATRRRLPAWMLLSGFCLAFATSVKPTVLLLPLLLLVWAVFQVRRNGEKSWRYLGFGLIGMATAVALNLAFLLAHHAVRDFLNAQRTITSYYAALTRLSIGRLLLNLAYPRTFLLLLLAGVVLMITGPRWNSEKWALALGGAVGLLSYLEQGKGFLHHRYMLFAFVLLLISVEFMRALRRPGWARWVGVGTLLYAMLLIVPHDLRVTHHIKPDSDLTLQMQADLTTLASKGDLQRRVQCLDLVYGCFNALYHLQLVENTGFTGDLLIFDPVNGPAVRAHRAMWWKLAQENPAEVLVVTNEYFQGSNGYSKLDHWPAYRHYLDENYVQLVERSFPYETGAYVEPAKANGYRIYVRRGSQFSSVRLTQT